MVATWLHILRGLLHTATRGARYAWIEFRIAELSAWVRACERDGLHRSLHLDRCRDEMAELRVDLATLERPIMQSKEIRT